MEESALQGFVEENGAPLLEHLLSLKEAPDLVSRTLYTGHGGTFP